MIHFARTRRGIGFLWLRGKAKHGLFIALAAAAATWFTGCARQEAPMYRYTSTGQREMFKRRPQNLEADRLPRVDRVAYLPGESLDTAALSEAQWEVVERFGHPEHVRKPFESTLGETVDEWLYRRSNYLVQWIDGHMAFEGEVTDIERVLLERGYPHFAFVSHENPEVERQDWIYDDRLKVQRDTLSFSNGELFYGQP